VFSALLKQVSRYDLSLLTEDVLKELYQELVDVETRHDLGEYYTPDWLADKIVQDTLRSNPEQSVLDPACGSGTFPYFAIRYKKQKMKSEGLLEHILNSVVGIDINPLAVIIAKTNYLLALGDLLKSRIGNINIPIYLANSVDLPQLDSQRQLSLIEQVPSVEFHLDKKLVYIPETILLDQYQYDRLLDVVGEFAISNKNKEVTYEGFKDFILTRMQKPLADGDEQALYELAFVLKELIEENRDSIWVFILKNLLKPIFFKGRFDCILGNPPWISYRYLESSSYQAHIKKLITEDAKLVEKINHNVSNLELATLFFVESAQNYLKENGTIAFVMPRSLYTADQHKVFRESKYKQFVIFSKIWDLDKVHPLFKVPSMVLFGQRGKKTQYPLPTLVLQGRLKKRNTALQEANSLIVTENSNVHLNKKGNREIWSDVEPSKGSTRSSVYKKSIMRGADLLPRAFWFVEAKTNTMLGINQRMPYLVTDEDIRALGKGENKRIFIEGEVEERFLFATLLSSDLVPFGTLRPRLVLLPLKKDNGAYKMITAKQAHDEGYVKLSEWLRKVEDWWIQLRGEKAENMSIYDYIDYRRKITVQKDAKYKVLYPTSASNLLGVVITDEIQRETSRVLGIKIEDYIANTKTYYYDTDNKEEAFYLASFLNAKVIDDRIKGVQSRGLFGPRDIHKKVWDEAMPKFNPKLDTHLQLGRLGEEAEKKIIALELITKRPASQPEVVKYRKLARDTVQYELKEINDIINRLIILILAFELWILNLPMQVVELVVS
jgi:methylase of polypeptide subunit release factors